MENRLKEKKVQVHRIKKSQFLEFQVWNLNEFKWKSKFMKINKVSGEQNRIAKRLRYLKFQEFFEIS